MLPRLIVITDWSLGEALLLERLAAALTVGPAVAVQHRHPEASARRYYEEACRVAQVAQRAGCAFFVNGRLDVALLVGAHLHLPSHSYGPSDVRPHLPAGRWVSVAVHGPGDVARAQGADLALVAPVFAPGSKPNDARPPLGPAGFLALARALPCPAFALGGLGPETAPALPGALGFAAISSVLRAADPKRAAAAILAAR
jgi:thiamine-phosphate pyrophosphorylase